MAFFVQYVRQRRKGIFVLFLFCLIFLLVFALYHLPLEAVYYPAILCGAAGSLLLVLDCRGAYRKHKRLVEMQELTAELMEDLPEAFLQEEKDYQQLIFGIRDENIALREQMEKRFEDMVDYYTTWAHQIKTPIASMRLTLQNEDSELSRKVTTELQRIEQYVDMVLCYLRLDSDSTDFVLCKVDLDGVVRQAVRKFAGQFVSLGIRLNYKPLETTVVTDEKWLLFVVEQILSNAIKYTRPLTRAGKNREAVVTIEMERPRTLCIRDTGIGISPEDLPRIFEKGYTGYNGRSDKKASGLGLYLCRRICTNLGHKISAESVPDGGTAIRINLEQREVRE